MIQRAPTVVATFAALLACHRGDAPSDSAARGSTGGTTSTASAASDTTTGSGFGSSTARRAGARPRSRPPAPPPEGSKHKGTPNHKLLWRVGYYGWSRLMGTPDQVSESKDMLLDFFAVQVEGGHQAIGGANEVLTSSHYPIWANGMTCARLLALHHDDPERPFPPPDLPGAALTTIPGSP